jgi:hypothetical protein
VENEVLAHGVKQVDGHEHIALHLATLPARLLDQERADAHQVAVRRDQGAAAPMGMGQGGEQRLVEHPSTPAMAGGDHGIAPAQGRRVAQVQMGRIQPPQGLNQSHATGEVVAHDMGGAGRAVIGRQSDCLGFRHQIADGDGQSARINQHGIARPFGPRTEAVKASSGTSARNATTAFRTLSRTKAKSPGSGRNPYGTSHSGLSVMTLF